MGVIRRGNKWCIRYYGPDGRQRWETIGPNKKEAETVLHQRLYEVRSGIFPILRRRGQITFQKLAEEWVESYAKAHVRPSTLSTYRWLLDHHLLPAFGDRALATLTPKDIQVYLAERKSRAVVPHLRTDVLWMLAGHDQQTREGVTEVVETIPTGT